MIALIQRVSSASVRVGGSPVGEIGQGVLIFLGVARSDTREQADALAAKCAALRIFNDPAGKMNLSVTDTGGGALVVSQFTLCADTSKGHRPGFSDAAPPEIAEPIYDRFCDELRSRLGPGKVAAGKFGAMMEVSLINDGPATFVLEV